MMYLLQLYGLMANGRHKDLYVNPTCPMATGADFLGVLINISSIIFVFSNIYYKIEAFPL